MFTTTPLYLTDTTILVNNNLDYWLPIPDHANHEISILGIIRNVKTKRQLRTQIHKTGKRCYVGCSIGYVHRLLISAQVGRKLETNEQV